jgi:hypothetical protein
VSAAASASASMVRQRARMASSSARAAVSATLTGGKTAASGLVDAVRDVFNHFIFPGGH